MNETAQDRCLSCPSRQQTCTGACACLADPDRRDILVHIANAAKNQLTCPLGRHDGMSSPEMVPTSPAPVGVIHGMIGIAKSVAWPGEWEEKPAVAKRLAICRQCPHVKPIFGVISSCGQCGCGLWSKTRLKGEHCPIGKW